eukprot:7796171-Prorocentrum_lima.AAC.1
MEGGGGATEECVVWLAVKRRGRRGEGPCRPTCRCSNFSLVSAAAHSASLLHQCARAVNRARP